MINCPFCERARNEDYLLRLAASVVFRPLTPVIDGHVLIVPLKHIEQPDFDLDTFGEVMKDAAYWAGLNLNDSSYNLIVQAGSAVQNIPHLHVHYVPRTENDGLRLPWNHYKRCRVCYCDVAKYPECSETCAHPFSYKGCMERVLAG